MARTGPQACVNETPPGRRSQCAHISSVGIGGSARLLVCRRRIRRQRAMAASNGGAAARRRAAGRRELCTASFPACLPSTPARKWLFKLCGAEARPGRGACSGGGLRQAVAVAALAVRFARAAPANRPWWASLTSWRLLGCPVACGWTGRPHVCCPTGSIAVALLASEATTATWCVLASTKQANPPDPSRHERMVPWLRRQTQQAQREGQEDGAGGRGRAGPSGAARTGTGPPPPRPPPPLHLPPSLHTGGGLRSDSRNLLLDRVAILIIL